MLKILSRMKKNQVGSTLVLVLVCMTFVGLLASTILVATATNLQMKTVDARSKSNFYTTEMALDELKIGLEETAQEKVKEAYAKMLSRYASTPESKRNEYMRIQFVNMFFDEFAAAEGSLSSTIKPTIDLEGYMLKAKNVYGAKVVSQGAITLAKDTTKGTVTFKNVGIQYTNSEGYSSTITTDLVFSPKFQSVSRQIIDDRGLYFSDYVLITDDSISKTGNDSSDVNGNIYAGKSIDSYLDSTLNLNCNYIVSRGTLGAADKGLLKVNSIVSGGSLSNEIWVKDVATRNVNNNNPSTDSKECININANSYVQDDLTLNTNGAKVKMNGTYFGYSNYDGTIVNSATAKGSSSIAINGRACELDLSGLNQLWLAGSNFIEVPSIYGSTSTTSSLLTKNAIFGGESVTFRGSQAAYLVPGDLIQGIGHNPVSYDEYLTISPSALSVEDEELYKTKYSLNPTTPVQTVFVNYFGDSDVYKMVYFYWKFVSPTAATQYFKDYVDVTKNPHALERLQKVSDQLQVAEIKYPGSNVLNTGNLLKVNSAGQISYGDSVSGGTKTTYDSNEVVIKKQSLNNSYKSLINTLSKDFYSGATTESLANNLVIFDDDTINGTFCEGIDTLASSNSGFVKNIGYESGGDNVIVISNRNLIIDKNSSGVILTSGNVTIKNCTFKGMIIAKKEIKLEAGAKAIADPDKVQELVEGDEDLKKFFRYSRGGNTSEGFDNNTITINYDNWHKE